MDETCHWFSNIKRNWKIEKKILINRRNFKYWIKHFLIKFLVVFFIFLPMLLPNYLTISKLHFLMAFQVWIRSFLHCFAHFISKLTTLVSLKYSRRTNNMNMFIKIMPQLHKSTGFRSVKNRFLFDPARLICLRQSIN